MTTLIDRAKELAYLSFFATLAAAAFSNSLFEISSSVFMVLWILLVAAERRWGVLKNKWAYLLAAYALVNFLSVSQTAYLHEALKGAFRVLRWTILTKMAYSI